MTIDLSFDTSEYLPARNSSTAVDFICTGAEKRRKLATKRALMLQQHMGLLPVLALVKSE